MKGRYYNIILLLLENNPQKLRWVTPISGRRVTLIKPLCRSSVFLLHHDASSSKCLLRVLWICVAFKVLHGDCDVSLGLCAHSVMSDYATDSFTLCDLMDHSLPGSSVHGISQTRILEWVVISYSRGSSRPRDKARVSCVACIGRWILYHWVTWLYTHLYTHIWPQVVNWIWGHSFNKGMRVLLCSFCKEYGAAVLFQKAKHWGISSV